MAKSRFGLILAGIYALVAAGIFIYARFFCTVDGLYCGLVGMLPVLPWMFLFISVMVSISLAVTGGPPGPMNDLLIWLMYAFSFAINVILAYIIGAVVQRLLARKKDAV